MPTLFTATTGQTLTYLLGVCPFSIAFLVFVNSSISFVVTDLVGIHNGEGDVVGTLGFADELLALAACPIWGLLSDRIGVRYVCTVGYAIIALALILFVQAKNIYPQLLLGRLFFSLGGAAVSTMVTAGLPAVTHGTLKDEIQDEPLPSNLTDSSQYQDNRQSRRGVESTLTSKPSSSKLAGFVGTCAGCGALLSLAIFLPLPARFEKHGLAPPEAIRRSYYIVGGVALLISGFCFLGLRNLPGEEGKGWKLLLASQSIFLRTAGNNQTSSVAKKAPLPLWRLFSNAVTLGFRNRIIGLGYVGGFVARASSVGISLYIPLYVNRFYRVSDLCDDDFGTMVSSGLGDIKRSCPKAYILASILTGVTQLVALITAPAFGLLSDKSRQYNLPLLFAALTGVVGYMCFALLPDPRFSGPNGNPSVFVVMALIGISQIGAIVCSLAVLSNGISLVNFRDAKLSSVPPSDSTERVVENHHASTSEHSEANEQQPLLERPADCELHGSHLRGSIAGVYSLYGGVGILILTKLGGLLFDQISPSTPFYIMASFNGVLLLTGVVCAFTGRLNSQVAA